MNSRAARKMRREKGTYGGFEGRGSRMAFKYGLAADTTGVHSGMVC